MSSSGNAVCNSCDKPIAYSELNKHKIDGQPHCKNCFDEISQILGKYSVDSQKETKAPQPAQSRNGSSFKPTKSASRPIAQPKIESPQRSSPSNSSPSRSVINSDRVCPNCFEAIASTYAKFCSSCGHSLTIPPVAEKAAERRASVSRPYQSLRQAKAKPQANEVVEEQTVVLSLRPAKRSASEIKIPTHNNNSPTSIKKEPIMSIPMESPLPEIDEKPQKPVETQEKRNEQKTTSDSTSEVKTSQDTIPEQQTQSVSTTSTSSSSETKQKEEINSHDPSVQAIQNKESSVVTETQTQSQEKHAEKKEEVETSKQETKTETDVSSRVLDIGVSSNRGRRKKNEDAHVAVDSIPEDPSTAFFAVFDGHGGSKASAYCAKKMIKHVVTRKCYATDKKKALRRGFIKADQKFLDKFEKDGCTAVVALLTADNHLYVANAGDSRCLVCKDNQAVTMTTDHKPNDEAEKKRIEDAGHDVVKDTQIVDGVRVHTWRIDGITAVSRSIGDLDFKDSFDKPPEEQAVTCVPDITETDVQKGQFIVLACDGVFDVMTNQEVVDFVVQLKQQNLPMSDIANELVNSAIERGSQDNVTVVLVGLD